MKKWLLAERLAFGIAVIGIISALGLYTEASVELDKLGLGREGPKVMLFQTINESGKPDGLYLGVGSPNMGKTDAVDNQHAQSEIFKPFLVWPWKFQLGGIKVTNFKDDPKVEGEILPDAGFIGGGITIIDLKPDFQFLKWGKEG